MNGFVLLFLELHDIDGIKQNDALTFGAVWRFCQRPSGVCDVSPETIGDMIYSSGNTVRRSLKVLSKKNMIVDITPERRGKSHEYIISEYAKSLIGSNPALPKMGRDNKTSSKNSEQSSTQNEQRNSGSIQNGSSALPKMGNVEVVVVDEKGDNPEKFETLLARWFENLKEPSPREIEMFGDYYDDHPKWTSRALDETIIAKPTQPFRYFKRIINEWIKKGGPQERPSPEMPPPKKYANGGRSYGNKSSSAGHKLTDEQARAAELVRKLKSSKSAGEPVA